MQCRLNERLVRECWVFSELLCTALVTVPLNICYISSWILYSQNLPHNHRPAVSTPHPAVCSLLSPLRTVSVGRHQEGLQEMGPGVRRLRDAPASGRHALLPPLPTGLQQQPGLRVDLPGLVTWPLSRRCPFYPCSLGLCGVAGWLAGKMPNSINKDS